MSNLNTVILWQNGNVMVFDDAGQQVPEFQGKGAEVCDRILGAASALTRFEFGEWRSGTMDPVSRDTWADEARKAK